jgi:hypothetical protein
MFAKLSSEITKSSLWDEDDHVVRVFIAFLAEKDMDGFVRGTRKTMRRTANVHDDPDGEKYDKAIQVLESPDPNSRTKDFEGRRIEPVDGGWIVLNHEQYKTHEDIQKEQNRERVRKWRERARGESNGKPELPPAPEPEAVKPPKPPKPKEEKKPLVIPEHLKEIWPKFIEMRKLIKKPATDFAQENIIAKLERLAPDDAHKQKLIVLQSIESSWSGVFEIKSDYKPKMTNLLFNNPPSHNDLIAQANRVKLT